MNHFLTLLAVAFLVLLPASTMAQDVSRSANTDDIIENLSPSMKSQLEWKGSLMFERKRLDIIYAMLDGVTFEQDVLLEGSRQFRPEKSRVNRSSIRIARLVPGYNLDSLLYIDPANWSFWLNGKKYTPKSKFPPQVSLVDINSRNVTLTWRDPDIDDIVPNWRAQYERYTPPDINNKVEISDQALWDYVSKDGRVFIDSKTGIVQFTIGPGQSFQTYTLSVLEGESETYYASFIPGEGDPKLISLDYDIGNMTPEEIDKLIETME